MPKLKGLGVQISYPPLSVNMDLALKLPPTLIKYNTDTNIVVIESEMLAGVICQKGAVPAETTREYV